MEKAKKILKVVIFMFIFIIILIIIFGEKVKIDDKSYTIDTNSTEYKEQYAIATAKLNKSLEVERKIEDRITAIKDAKEKKLQDAKASKDLITLEYELKIERYLVLADFAIKNDSNGELTDIRIGCSYYSPTNTLLGQSKKVLYIEVPKHKSKKISDFKMGIAPQQASKNSCEILNYLFEGVRVYY